MITLGSDQLDNITQLPDPVQQLDDEEPADNEAKELVKEATQSADKEIREEKLEKIEDEEDDAKIKEIAEKRKKKAL
jgi:hypothetical protein